MFMDPYNILAACNITSTDVVADFGAGAGFVAYTAARFATHGQVYAIEINRDIVARMSRDINERNIKNVVPLWGDIEVRGGTGLKDESVDFVILSNIMFQLEDREGCISEVKRVLKAEGRVLVVDWKESFAGMGPAPHQVFSKLTAEDFFGRAGFALINNIQAGEHHFGLLFKK